MSFIPFRGINGKLVYVNPAQVCYFGSTSVEGETAIIFTGDGENSVLFVEAPIEKVIKKFRGEYLSL